MFASVVARRLELEGQKMREPRISSMLSHAVAVYQERFELRRNCLPNSILHAVRPEDQVIGYRARFRATTNLGWLLRMAVTDTESSYPQARLTCKWSGFRSQIQAGAVSIELLPTADDKLVEDS